MKKTQHQFRKERKKTDESLTLERGKADESFKGGRADTHDNTDLTISKNRFAADHDKLQRRRTADLKRNATDTGSRTSRNVSEDIGFALIDQRKSEDKAIENERLNIDAAISRERGEKEKIVDIRLVQERESTDKNLVRERVKSDIEVERVGDLLSVEHTAHAETKSALTTHEEFVAIVSHDLRNPIGAILSSAEILLEDASQVGLSGEARELVELIKRNAETSMRLISDILDMERIAEGKIQLQLSKNQIDDIIKESVESFSHSASSKRILLKHSSSRVRNSILCDKDRIAQVLSNLIGNALKFTPAGGSVIVEAQQTESEVLISVSDTGPGIPDDQKIRIFERFAQIGNKQRTGLGLGLYLSKMFVESHSGKIWVTSIPGSGSTFWFTLPIEPQIIQS